MKIRNWSKFVHYGDRKSPWIKLYRNLLDKKEWHLLNPQDAKVLVMIWLIASEFNGSLPSIKTISFKLRMSEKETKEAVLKLSKWFEHDDDKMSNE